MPGEISPADRDPLAPSDASRRGKTIVGKCKSSQMNGDVAATSP